MTYIYVDNIDVHMINRCTDGVYLYVDDIDVDMINRYIDI